MFRYEILQAETSAELEELVASYLNDGWRLAGGVCCVRRDIQPLYVQPAAFRYVQAVFTEVNDEVDSD